MDCWPLLVYAIGGFLSFIGIAIYCGIAKVEEHDIQALLAFGVAGIWPVALVVAIIVGLFQMIKNAAAKI